MSVQLPVRIISVTEGRAVPAHGVGERGFKEVVIFRQQTLEDLRREISIITPQVESLRDKQKQLNIINRYRNDKRSVLAVLDTLAAYEYMPRKVALTDLDFKKGLLVDMEGYALSLNDLHMFMGDLSKATFGGVEIFDTPYKRRCDLDKMLEAVSAGAAQSWMVENLGPKMRDGDFAPGFMIDLQQKDLRLALEAARERLTPLPGTALVHQLFAANQAAGQGRQGTQALINTVARLAGQ